MSLLLCRQEPVKHPYYIEVLGIHIYSSQELCYVIYNNPLLVLEGFVEEPLLVFIREELDMAYLADKLKVLMESKSRGEDLLLLILSECDYYTEQERNRFKQAMTGIRRMHPAEYAKARADYLFQKKQYGKAAVRYEKLLEYPEDKVADQAFKAKIQHNLGASYAQMSQFDKVFKALDVAYGKNKDVQTLKQIYYLTVFEPALGVGERYLSLFTQELKEEWEREMITAEQNAMVAEEVVKLRELFTKDSVKRAEGASGMIQRWKREHRIMI